jgi:hypothetical protein
VVVDLEATKADMEVDSVAGEAAVVVARPATLAVVTDTCPVRSPPDTPGFSFHS